MGERICVNGVWYVREDALPAPSEPRPEPFEPLKRLCSEYGVDPHRAYRAVADGRLDAPLPNGCRRGRRCRRSEFVRWQEEDMGRCV